MQKGEIKIYTRVKQSRECRCRESKSSVISYKYPMCNSSLIHSSFYSFFLRSKREQKTTIRAKYPR